MQVKQLSLDQVKKIYYEDMVNEFHVSEMKSYSHIVALIEHGNYLCFGLFEGEDIMGYAFFVKEVGAKHILLDYYVVLEKYRNGGMGGRFLKLLYEVCADYDTMIIEVENPEYATTEAARSLQSRRIGFYERNGFVYTELQVNLFTAEFVIMCYGIKCVPPDQEIERVLDGIYHTMFKQHYDGSVDIRYVKGTKDTR